MPLKILFLSSWFPSKKHTSLGNFVERHAQAAALHNDVHVLYATAMEDVGEGSDEPYENGTVNGTIRYYPRKKGDNLFALFGKSRRYLKRYTWLVDDYIADHGKPDILHLHVMMPAAIVANHIAKKYNIPMVVTEHWTGYTERDGAYAKLIPPLKRIIRTCVKRADVILPVSHDLEKALKGHFPNARTRVIPNCVDTELFRPEPVDDTILRILHVSNLRDDQKNIEGLVKGLSRLERPFSLTVVAEEGRGRLEALCEDNGIAHYLNWKERLNATEVAKVMREHHVFVLFSRYENLPCVLIEALASGMLIVSTDVGGIGEYFDHPNGHLIQSEDQEALTNSLENLDIQSRNEWQKRRAFAEREFSYAAVGKKLDEVYKSVAG